MLYYAAMTKFNLALRQGFGPDHAEPRHAQPAHCSSLCGGLDCQAG